MNASHIVHLLWYVVTAIWLAAAFVSKRTVQRQSWSSRWLQTVINAAGLLFLFSEHVRVGILGVQLYPVSRVIDALGIFLTAAGSLLALGSRLTLGRNWSGDVTLKQDHVLITRGPYRFSRHPIYSSLLLMVLGTALVSGVVASFLGLACIFIGLWLKLRAEESLMQQQFGEQYETYKQRVKALIPGVL